MIIAEIILGAPDWLVWAVPIALLALITVGWSYASGRSAGWVRASAALLKTGGVLALVVCLIEPLFSGTRPRPGSNLFLVVADNSRSLEIHDRGNGESRGQVMRDRLDSQAGWLARLGQDFDVRRYAFDSRLQPLKDFSELTLDGEETALVGSLAALADRFAGRPIAGVLLLTDGNATDLPDQPVDWTSLPPVYPVVIGEDRAAADTSVARVSVSQTNFEAAPVTVVAELDGQGVAGRAAVVRLLDEDGKEVDRQTIEKMPDEQTVTHRFQVRPEKVGISFYTVHTSLQGEEQLTGERGKSAEATLANNRRLAVVDRGGGPYRVLYVSGKLNWDFKFLRRALEEDDEVDLAGLVRIARREPKLTFRGRPGERTNPIFRGFGTDAEQAEQYDEPVLLRLGLETKDELRGGFPQTADELFRYHAIILDDIEAGFFRQEQMSLIQQFVSQRGGGLLMMGGRDSFIKGEYQRTPVGELLPVYLDRGEAQPGLDNFRLQLTREGWLQPWVRFRTTEEEERKRLTEMPAFQTVNRVSAIKPGASVLASVLPENGPAQPALVVQPFGRGRVGALLIGDMWRWNLRRESGTESDLEKSWRQTVRWLVADVPQRVEVETQSGEQPGRPLRITVRIRDELYAPLDNATVRVRVKTPDNRTIELAAEASERAAGEYLATFASRTPGAYRATVTAQAADGSEVGTRETGWAFEPATEEFRTLRPNRALLEQIATETGGEVIALRRLEEFVSSLPNRKVPVVEAWTYPLWHRWSVFLFAVGCLVGEWGLRRWKGLP